MTRAEIPSVTFAGNKTIPGIGLGKCQALAPVESPLSFPFQPTSFLRTGCPYQSLSTQNSGVIDSTHTSTGTWLAPPGEVGNAVTIALQEGYRHIDCALIYKNEAEVGQGIKRSGVPRDQIFITSKLWNSFHDNAVESLDRTLRDLGTDYLDLYVGASDQDLTLCRDTFDVWIMLTRSSYSSFTGLFGSSL